MQISTCQKWLPWICTGAVFCLATCATPVAFSQVFPASLSPEAREQLYSEVDAAFLALERQGNLVKNVVRLVTPTVVQKTFTARDLPAKFTIDVPTPRGLHPVYPRMLFVRREVVAPNQQPLPLPEDAKPPTPKPGDELRTLPNPLLTGTQPPPPQIVRPVKTVSVPLTASHFANKSGEVPTSDFLKWPKTSKESVPALVYLIGGELPSRPTPV